MTVIISCVSYSCAVAKHAIPDAYYREQIKRADSLTSRRLAGSVDTAMAKRNVRAAADIYLKLSRKYEMTDPISFFYYSVGAENPDGFYEACKLLILGSADSVNEIIARRGNIYGGNDLSALKREPLATAVKRIKAKEGELILSARVHLDWSWNIELCGLFRADIDFREFIPREYFKDNAAWGEALVLLDSNHLVELCELVEKKGFPYRATVGENAARIMTLLRHFAGLIYFEENPGRGDFYVEKLKYLMPFVHKAVATGQLDRSFYVQYMGWVIGELKKGDRKKDLEFFRKYEIAE